MIISNQYNLNDYAKPLHDMNEEQIRAWAKEADSLMNDKHLTPDKYEISVRVSERGSHIYVDAKKDNKLEVTIEPAMMGNKIDNPIDLVNALYDEFASRERSLGYIRGEVDGAVFENKYKPEGIEEKYDPRITEEKEEDEYEEDRAC